MLYCIILYDIILHNLFCDYEGENMKKPATFDEAILNTTKSRRNIYGDATQREVLYTPWDKNYAKTLGEFYDDFVAPRLPDPEVVLQWHEVIKYYSEQKNVIFPIRAGNTKGHLRRGWLVNVNNHFSYMFTDNDLAVYIYKMALDGFCPDKDEFVEYMTEFKDVSDIGWLNTKKTGIPAEIDKVRGISRKFMQMPARFNKAGGPGIDSTETEKNAYINCGPAPSCCLGKYNYKHAHIIDVAGRAYEIPGRSGLIEWKNIKSSLLGDVKDYCWDPVKCNYIWERTISPAEEAELRVLFKAHLFRFLNPLNHFLAPLDKQNRYINADKVPQVDIAEYENLQKHIIMKKSAVFTSAFKEFLTETRAPKEWRSTSWADNSSEEIQIVYHEKSLTREIYGASLDKHKSVAAPKSKKSSSSTSAAKKATSTTPKKNKKTLKELEAKYTYGKLIEVAACYLSKSFSLKEIERQMHLKEALGFEAQNILQALGIITNGTMKNCLNSSNIDSEISKATGILKDTLIEIKNRKLL